MPHCAHAAPFAAHGDARGSLPPTLVHRRSTLRRSRGAEQGCAAESPFSLHRRHRVGPRTSKPTGKGCAPKLSSTVRSAPTTACSGHPLPIGEAAALSATKAASKSFATPIDASFAVLFSCGRIEPCHMLGINFGGTWNGRTFDIKGFDSDEAVEIPLGNTGELSGQCANGIP